jgi:SAM-dependent methyltransferase
MTTSDRTLASFRDKWNRNPTLAFDDTQREGSDLFNWILSRNGCADADEFTRWLAPRARILDAGCGNGRVTALLHRYAAPGAQIVAVDAVSDEVARENLAGLDRVSVHRQDLLGDLSGLGAFDLIYCQEVLHHTSDPRQACLNLAARLTPGGEIAVYVYKIKAPLRERADDYLRERVTPLPYDDAIAAMTSIAQLGRALADLHVHVTVPDVALLGIEQGTYDVQRLIYHFFLKCFWNPALSLEENAAINYDWYHPQLSSRHTPAEVESWFADADLTIVHRSIDPYGITLRGLKGPS